MGKILAIIMGLLLLVTVLCFGTNNVRAIPASQTVKTTIDSSAINADHTLIQYYDAVSKVCQITINDQVNNFGWGGWKLQSGITDYKINYSSMPANLSREIVEAAFNLAFSNIQGAGGGILFHQAGESQESVPSNNGQNSLTWAVLPISYVAVTYIWTDSNGRLANADTVFNLRYSWAYTGYNGENDCSGYKGYMDLRNIATHEFGHWAGLGDLYDSTSRDLTMYGYANRGELKKDTLGLGDITGIRAVWP